MKFKAYYIVWLYLIVLLLTSGCKMDHELRQIHISDETVKSIVGKVLVQGAITSDFYDLQICDDGILVLDRESDSGLRIFDFTNGGLKQIKEGSALKGLSFINQLFYHAGESVVLYDEQFGNLYDVMFSDSGIDLAKRSLTIPPPPAGVNSEINLNDSGYYYIKSYPTFIASYVYRNVKSDETFVGEPYDYLPSNFPDRAVAFLSHFIVNEKEEVIYTVSRFTNSIQRYDISGKLEDIYILGEKQELPLLNNGGKNIDVPNAKKHFIQICGTHRYVYCLYSGSPYMDSDSKVIVLNWRGKYINSYNLNKSVSCIAIEQSDNNLYAIARNDIGGTDVLKYSLKGK